MSVCEEPMKEEKEEEESGWAYLCTWCMLLRLCLSHAIFCYITFIWIVME